MTTSFIKRRIDIEFQLGEGNFGEAGTNTVKLTGLRSNVSLVKNGGVAMGTMQLRTFGITLSTMNKLSTLGLLPNGARKNFVRVWAGDDERGMTEICKGLINDAYVDMGGAPDACFNVIATEGSWEAMHPATPTSFPGGVDVAQVIKTAADKAGLGFENNGVTVTLQNPYQAGTARQQIYEAAEAAHINVVIDRGIVAIWPKGAARGNKLPVISPSSGMRGYPTFTSNGVQLQCLFMPELEFGVAFKLESILTAANKTWVVQRLQYNLESETQGPWFMTIDANEPQYAVGRVQPK